ncbi:hypothetical protein ACRAWC_08330 [Leifsonia sp. L25]|uniref:hypothetical protein n=1 Tax=Leifsonia sp. L25 TaxID=3423957 RepID=UPI003D6867D0
MTTPPEPPKEPSAPYRTLEADWGTPLERIPLPGGQGAINVNSWSPDSARFAYVSYPHGPRRLPYRSQAA